MADIKKIVEDSFTRYAGNVIMNRAICDARDLLKPSARMLMYCQMAVTKNIPSKPFVKSARVVGDALGHYYEHGDSSCYGTYMRMSKPFAMRYPLEDCQGNNGTLNNTSDEASMRYTELRLSPLGYSLFGDIDKETIFEWSNNFDETEKYPKVAPSKGYYNICNGTVGLGIALSSSIPQFNLREVNEALIKLLWNSDIPFEEICVMPDYATGALLLNADEVKKSLEEGAGAAAKLRSVIEYDKSKRALIVRELPYGVYTETISAQIQKLLEKEPNCGIDNVNDASHKKPDYEIYLTKNASPEKVLKLLYKETSLESFSGINMTVLVDGKKPAVLGLRELFQAHLDHEKTVYINGFQFDRRKILARLHILEALIKAISMIDEVVKTIKQAADTKNASIGLQRLLGIDEAQAKAILDLKLSRLTHLDVSKLMSEKTELEKELARIEAILADENLLKKEIEKGLREVAEKFGDARRTKILNISNEEETIERKQLALSFTNDGAVFVNETSTLYSQRRNGVGQKFKLDKGEYVVDTLVGENTNEILFFTDKGHFYVMKMGDFTVGEKQYLNTFVSFQSDEQVRASVILSKEQQASNIVFITKNGILKKSSLSEYNLKRGNGAQAIKLDENDTIVSVLILRDENIGVLSHSGNFIMISTSDIRPIGRVTRGVVGMKLNEGDYVVSARVISKETKEILSISEDGSAKRTSIEEFGLTGRATKGKSIQQSDKLCDFLPLIDDKEVLVVSNVSQIRLKINEIPLLSRATMGVKVMKLKDKEKIQNLVGLNS